MKDEKKMSKILFVKLGVIAAVISCFAVSLIFSSQLTNFINAKFFNYELNPNECSASDVFGSNYYVSYIDVGQGNCTFAYLPDGKTLLIDGGNTQYGDDVCKFLKDHNIDSIDYMIATHADADHIGGLVAVLENYDVKNIYRPFQIAGDGTSLDNFAASEYEQLAGIFKSYNDSKISRVTSNVYKNFIEGIYTETVGSEGEPANVVVFYDGLEISGGNYSINFYSPQKREDNLKIEDRVVPNEKGIVTKGYTTKSYGASESNQNSAIFMLKCYDDKYFFTGDSEWRDENSTKGNFAETDFLSSLTKAERDYIFDVDVFILGHHGSKYSSGEELLDLLSPRFIIISVGKNSYGHPTQETLDRVANVEGLERDYLLRTDYYGTVTFSNVGGKLSYSRETNESGDRVLQEKVSWVVVGGAITLFICGLVLCIKVKPKKSRKGNV